MTFLALVLFTVLAIVAYIALRNAQDFSDANQVVPGVETRAPKGWAGGHSQEARLHRRLRDAVVSLQANASLDDPSLIDVRTSLEQEALGVDDRLVAVASLPKAQKVVRLPEVEKAVQAIENAVASVVELRGPSLESVERGIEEVKARLLLVEAARRELEGLSPTAQGLDELRQQLEETSGAGSPPPSAEDDDPDANPGATPDATP